MGAKHRGQRGHKVRTWRKNTGDREATRRGHGGNTQRTKTPQVEDMEKNHWGQRGHKLRTWRQNTVDRDDTSRGHGGKTQGTLI